jgi:hypothetical protein
MKTINLYYNLKTAAIVAASPVEQEEFKDLAMVQVPFDDGLAFLTGEKSFSEWFIVGKPDNYVLTNNPLDIPPLHSGGIYLIPRARNSTLFCGIAATVYLASDLIEFSIPTRHAGIRLKAVKERELTFYLTKRNDPEHIIKEITISVKKLIAEGSIKIKLDLEGEHQDFSLLTTRVFNQYRFEVIKSVWFQQTTGTTAKINNLVAFKERSKVDDDEKCILAIHHKKKNRITLRLQNGADVAGFDGMQGLIFLTAPRDPTVIIHHYTLDISSLLDGRVIEFPVPKDVTGAFGLGGIPLAENLFFVKQK